MHTTKQMPEVHGQFDALGALSLDTGTVDAWSPLFPTGKGPISRWWADKKGRPVVTDVASAREMGSLSDLAFAFETWAPRLA